MLVGVVGLAWDVEAERCVNRAVERVGLRCGPVTDM
jgi:hypothetical protein